jgi:cytoskeleton protein RodZ
MSDPTIGERLKAERERRGISTQKAADDMHLDAWVIEALEAGDYARIGPSVYAKGYLRKYASTLGVTTGEVAMGADKPPAAPRPPVMRVQNATDGSAQAPVGLLIPLLGLLIVVSAAAVLWYRPWRSRSPSTVTPARVTATGSEPTAAAAASPEGSAAGGTARSEAASGAGGAAAAADADEAGVGPEHEAAVAPGAGGAVQSTAHAGDALPNVAPGMRAAAAAPAAATLAGATGAGAGAPVRGAGPARLRLSFSADSWVEVLDAAGRRVYSGQGHANSVKTIAGLAPLKVYLGYASGVQLEVNDHAVAIGRQFVSGDVARFEAGADGVLRRSSAPAATAGATPPHG